MKVYILTTHQVSDLEDFGIITKAYDSEAKAIAALKEWRDDEIKHCTDNEYIIEYDEPTYFEAYEDGCYCSNHSYGRVEEIEVE